MKSSSTVVDMGEFTIAHKLNTLFYDYPHSRITDCGTLPKYCPLIKTYEQVPQYQIVWMCEFKVIK